MIPPKNPPATGRTATPSPINPSVESASRADFSKCAEKADKRLAAYLQGPVRTGLDAELAKIKEENQPKEQGDVEMNAADRLLTEPGDPPLEDPPADETETIIETAENPGWQSR